MGVIALPIVALLLWLFLRQTPAPSSDIPPQEKPARLGAILSFLVVPGFFGVVALLEIVTWLSPNLSN